MDDQPTGRGVYVVRRILAVLVLLLLLALLVPQAYQALLDARDETGSGVKETADVSGSKSDGSYEKGALNRATGSVAEDVAKQDDDLGNPSHNGETGLSAAGTSRSVETSEGEEYGGRESIESGADLTGVANVFEEVAVGEGGQTVANPVVDAVGQQPFQPMLPAEPTVTVDLLSSVEPISLDAIFPQDQTYYDYPIYYEDPYAAYYDDPAYYDYAAYYGDPAYYDYAAFYDNPAYYDYAPYYEEQVFIGSGTLDIYYDAAVVSASAQEDGGTGAYAAAGGGAGAYAAVSTG
jgi:hypothetical protein